MIKLKKIQILLCSRILLRAGKDQREDGPNMTIRIKSTKIYPYIFFVKEDFFPVNSDHFPMSINPS